MSLLHPWALALAPLATLPILLHLRRREISRRVSFPALRYLTQAREAHARSLRAADLLLMWVRVGLILALVFAAAGPLVGRGGSTAHVPTDVALVVDNSASTRRLVGDAPLLRRLVARARQTVSAAGSGDRFWVWPAVGPLLAAGVGAVQANEALERLPATDGRADLPRRLADAAAALPGGEERGREVQLLSDLQATSFGMAVAAQTGESGSAGPGRTDTVRSGDRTDDDVPVVVYDPGGLNASNGAVTAVEFSAGRTWPAGLAQTAVVEARRFAATQVIREPFRGDTTVLIRIDVDGTTAGAAVNPWGADAIVPLPALEPGFHAGRAEIDPHGLRADDVRYFALRVVPPYPVAHMGPPGSFVSLGLETLRAAGRIGTAGPPRIRILEGSLAPNNVVEMMDSATGWLSPASLVFIPPADPIALSRFNQLLDRAGTPWRLAVDSLVGSLELAGTIQVPGLEDSRIHRRYLLNRAPGLADDTVLLHTGDGAPWLIRGTYRGRVCVLLASPLNPEATNLPTQPAMIPFLETLLLRWSPQGTKPMAEVDAGDSTPLPPWVHSVRRPDGTTRTVEGGAPFTPWKAGIYRFFARIPAARESAASLLAANVPVSESNLASLAPVRVQELFPGRTVHMAGPDPNDWDRAIFRRRRGVDTTLWWLVVAVALAAAEGALATPGKHRKTAAVSDVPQTADVS